MGQKTVSRLLNPESNQLRIFNLSSKRGNSVARHQSFFARSVAFIMIWAIGMMSTCPANIVPWAVDANGEWTTPTSWSSGALHLLADDVILNRAATYTVTITGATQSINSISSNENIVFLGGGGLSVAVDSSISGAVDFGGFSSPVLGGSGNMTLSGPVIWSAGTMSGTGKTILTSSSTTYIGNQFSSGLNLRRTIDNSGFVTMYSQNSSTGILFNNAVFNNLEGGIQFREYDDRRWQHYPCIQ
jgi:hypothetical protein